MKKLLILTIILCGSILAVYADKEQKQLYLYNTISFEEEFDAKNFSAKIDNGKTIEKIKDKDGKKLKFRTPAAVLTYISSLGWEICNMSSSSYWIIRKPCTPQELKQAIEEGTK